MYVQSACTCTCTSGMYGVHVYVLRNSSFEFSNGKVWESDLRILILTFKHAYTCKYSVIMSPQIACKCKCCEVVYNNTSAVLIATWSPGISYLCYFIG